MNDYEARIRALSSLTKREKEVFALRCQRLGISEIARRLFVTESTVNFHSANIRDKLGLRSPGLSIGGSRQAFQKYCDVFSAAWEELEELQDDDDSVEPEPVVLSQQSLIAVDDSDWELIQARPNSIRPWIDPPPIPPVIRPHRTLMPAVIGGLVGATLIAGAFLMFGPKDTTVVFVTPVPSPVVQQTIGPANTVNPVVSTPISPPQTTQTQQATRTPTATPAPPRGTQPGTVLNVGETWRQSDLELTLSNSKLFLPGWGIASKNPAGIGTQFKVVNRKQQPFQFILSGNSFSATDNLGRTSRPERMSETLIYESPNYDWQFVVDLRVNESNDMHGFHYQWIVFRFDTGDRAVNEVIVTASMGGITEARWRIPINR